MKLLIIFIYLVASTFSHAEEKLDIKNLVLTKKPKTYENVIFNDANQNSVNLSDFKGKLLILNFWATWCAPCKEEMPSLDRLVDILGPEYVEIIAVNVETVYYKKSKQFLDDLKVKNFDSYFDKDLKVIKKLRLRGVPTTLLINKEGKEFARIVGSIDFADKEFISWIKNF